MIFLGQRLICSTNNLGRRVSRDFEIVVVRVYWRHLSHQAHRKDELNCDLPQRRNALVFIFISPFVPMLA